ncbi:MAG: SRPBCC family protein [Acidobacteriota bacterium]
MASTFERTLELSASPAQVFAWHSRRAAFERLVPPWLPISILDRPEALVDDSRLSFEVRQGGIGLRWVARHENVVPGEGFVDVQEKGPFALWRHEHLMEPAGSGGSLLRDRIRYRLPLAPLSKWVAGPKIRADLEAMFAYRHHVTWHDLEMHRRIGAAPSSLALVAGRTRSARRIAATLEAILDTGGHRVERIEPEADLRGSEPWDCWVDLELEGRSARVAGCPSRAVVTAFGSAEPPAERRAVHLHLAPLHPAPRPLYRRLQGPSEGPWVSVDDAASALACAALSETLEGTLEVSATAAKASPGRQALRSAGFRLRHTDWQQTCRRYEGQEREAWGESAQVSAGRRTLVALEEER